MLRKPSSVSKRLLDRIIHMPVVDCHEHLRGPDRDLEVSPTEPISALTFLYTISDLWAAGASEEEISFEKAIISTGSHPTKVPGLSIDSPRVVDSTGALDR